VGDAQFCAPISFAFNAGVSAPERTTLLQVINRGNFDQAPAQFLRWTKAGGKRKPICGVIPRRKKMDITGIGSVADLITTTINKIWPDKSEQEKLAMAHAFSLIQGQLQVNQTEAANPSMFVAGWRPSIGWVCSLALLYQFVLRPLIEFAYLAAGHPLANMPGIDNNLWELLAGMLGLGGLRTFEKAKKVTR